VVLSHGLWVDRFGADPGIVGRTITLSGQAKEVVGVMPAGFAFPDESVEAWESFGLDEADPPGRGSHYIRGIARLEEGVTLEQARAEVESIHAGWVEEYEHNVAHFPILHRLEDDVVRADVRRALFLLLAAVGIVLLVACANVANLYLARAEKRQREVALRAALGAGQGRVVRQFLTESLVVAGAGGGLGVLSAGWITRGILAVNPDALPRMSGIEVSGPVLAFTAAVTVGTAVLFGVVPAIWAGGRARAPGVAEARGATGGPGHGRLRRILVGSEVAMSVVVLVAAGLLVRSFDVLTSVDPGIDPEGVLTFRVATPPAERPSDAEVRTFYQELLERLEGLPGVTLATAGGQVPLTGANNRNDFAIRGRAPRRQGELALNAQTMDVRPGYFEALGIPLRRGRAFTAEDGPQGPPVAVVNEELTRLYFPDGDPIGQFVGYPWVSDSTWMRVVGVVGDFH
ncbi:MAG: FtsX-like permease family protein, partial [Gemmatimonadetes bacterium]|nr:FtsX-like permease family protein [Gemmatimonadota bacterium]NIR78979.1 FtsX-like permease family protein [Gemmatimonadota bacterium]NIT87628.1 FtsX-like permease family protein [Gemmatimonadota bacterium]NIU31490.1 FtsX-like permease family protein [Gemmatimonadota bacterium]NIU36157.1 FtsX-like permease family protein [Gemmatimonadota bacterium]